MKHTKTEHHGHPEFYRMTQEELTLHDQKNKDYTQGGDPLGNFKRVSAVLKTWGFNISPALVGLIYMLKQLDCAMWMQSHGYEGEVETFDKRLQDVHVYAKLARILYQEQGEEPPAELQRFDTITLCRRCKKRAADVGRKHCKECLEKDRLAKRKAKEQWSTTSSPLRVPSRFQPSGELCSLCRAPLIDDEQGKCSACLAT